jgi:hypothetical protein
LLTHYGQQCSYRGETFVSTALNVYQTAYAIIKASSVMIGVDE